MPAHRRGGRRRGKKEEGEEEEEEERGEQEAGRRKKKRQKRKYRQEGKSGEEERLPSWKSKNPYVEVCLCAVWCYGCMYKLRKGRKKDSPETAQ